MRNFNLHPAELSGSSYIWLCCVLPENPHFWLPPEQRRVLSGIYRGRKNGEGILQPGECVSWRLHVMPSTLDSFPSPHVQLTSILRPLQLLYINIVRSLVPVFSEHLGMRLHHPQEPPKRRMVWWCSADSLGCMKLISARNLCNYQLHCRKRQKSLLQQDNTAPSCNCVHSKLEKPEELADQTFSFWVESEDETNYQIFSSCAGGGAHVPREWPHSHQRTDSSCGCEHKGPIHGQRGGREGEPSRLSRGNRTMHSYSL